MQRRGADPQPDSPASSSRFPKTPMEPAAPGFRHLPGSAGIAVMEVGVRAQAGEGGGHPNWRESALSPPPPPAPRDTAGWESSSAAWWGGGSAMVSRLRGRPQAAPGCPGWAVGSKHTSQVHTRPWPEPPRHSQAGVRRPDDPTWQHRVLLPGPQALLSCRLCTSGLRSSRRLSQCLPTPTGSRSHVVCVKHPHPAAALAPPTPDSQ